MITLPSVSIIIVNWNSGPQLLDVIKSIALYHRGVVASVIIVDNGSTDNSLNEVELQTNLPFQLKFILNLDNRGFGVACNQGADLAETDYFLFLNPDTKLFENSLTGPLSYLQDSENQDVGVVGIQMIDENNHISHSCARFPDLKIFVTYILGINRLPFFRHLDMHMSDWSHNQTSPVDHVIGAFYLIRSNIFKSLGGFDENYFVYLEDLDLSLRVRKLGFKIVFFAESQAFHAGGGTSRQVKAHRLFYSMRSRLFYGFKNFPFHNAFILAFLTILIEPFTRISYLIFKGLWRDAFYTMKAYFMLSKSILNYFISKK